MMQTASDPFLGYTRFGGHDYLVRQLADHKAGLEPTELTAGRSSPTPGCAAKCWPKAMPAPAMPPCSRVTSDHPLD